MKDQDVFHDRYPGARPFSDAEADHKTFFGRETEVDDLSNQVLSSNLVVLYGDSGVGKTSLLQAGVFPLLRQRYFLPLPILLNQPAEQERLPLLEVCWAAIEKACEYQQIKYTPGEKTGLWEFFKTAIFLKGAELQEPVLVFDQFEDIFHFYDLESRRAFASELGWLLGRTPPDRLRARLQAGERLLYSEAQPNVKVLLSVRADHLGELQEFTEYLPAVLRNLFRLVPLSRERAERAIVGPADLKSEEFRVPPFEFSEAAVKEILNFLAREADELEPLALQVLCRQIEQNLADKQGELRRIELQDLGGRAGLEKTLHDFYVEAINSLPFRQHRRARKSCADALVSVDRHRLLIHGNELIQTYGVSNESLAALAEKHILRQVEHLGSSYYELSCDVLVPSVLKERPWPSDKVKTWMVRVLSAFVVIFAVVSLYLNSQIKLAHKDAEIANREIRHAYDVLNQANKGFMTVTEANDELNKSLESLLPERPESKRARGHILTVASDLNMERGEKERALSQARQAKTLAEQFLNNDSSDDDWQRLLYESAFRIGDLLADARAGSAFLHRALSRISA